MFLCILNFSRNLSYFTRLRFQREGTNYLISKPVQCSIKITIFDEGDNG